MLAYIRDIQSFAHIDLLKIMSYNIPIFSENDENGTFSIIGEKEDYSGSWCLLDNKMLYYVDSVSSKDGITDVTLKLPFHAFDRKLIYSGEGTEKYGTFISSIIQSEFIEQPDIVYQMPYLTVTSEDETEFSFPVNEGDDYLLSDIILQAEKDGVRFDFTADETGVQLVIHPFTQETHNVFIGNGHNVLNEQSWSSSLVAKVSVLKDNGSSTTEKIFYWQADGSVSETPPDPRIRGVWDVVKISSDDSFEDAAKEAMKDNSSSYKVEFYSDRTDLSFGDKVFIRLKEKTSEVTVSAAFYSNEFKGLLVKCGSLTTTLSERLQKYLLT